MYLAWWDMCLQGFSEAIFLKPGMGFKGSVYVCLGVSGPMFTVRPVYLPGGAKALPVPLVTCIGIRFRSLLPRPSVPGIETHWLHLWIRLDPNKEMDFVLGKHGVGGKGRERDTDQSGTVIYILRFQNYGGSGAHCFASEHTQALSSLD